MEAFGDAAAKLGVEVKMERVTDYAEMAMAGEMSTPGITVDGKLVYAGGLSDPAALERWLAA